MVKLRRKFDIRAAAFAEVALLREAARLRAAFLQPKPVSWHDIFCRRCAMVIVLQQATCTAGITKLGVYFARAHTPSFAQCGHTASAQAARRASRVQKSCFGSTIN